MYILIALAVFMQDGQSIVGSREIGRYPTMEACFEAREETLLEMQAFELPRKSIQAVCLLGV